MVWPRIHLCVRGFMLCVLINFVNSNFVFRGNMYIFANWQYASDVYGACYL